MNQLDEEMFACLQSGDERNFGRLVLSLQESARLYAISIVIHPVIAYEIVNDVFLKLWTSRDQLNIRTSFRSYLFRMIHNHCCDYLRVGKRISGIATVSLEDMQSRLEIFEIADTDTFFDTLFSEQFEAALMKEMDKLPEKCREIFKLSKFEQFTYPEIADRLNLSLSTVKTQMILAMVKLREALKDFL